MYNNKKILSGTVVKKSSNKTIKVFIIYSSKHLKYKKNIKKKKFYLVHDEKNLCLEGDKVKIIETKPISKKKRWSLISKL